MRPGSIDSVVDQTAGTTPADAPAPAQDVNAASESAASERPGFSSRGRARRRARFLRRARELAYRDLGGLVFNLHRFGQRNDALVLAKLSTLGHIDAELRALEAVLRERRPLTVLREAGITACPRCAAIHGSEDRFCPNCGFSIARHADLPIAGAPSAVADPAAPASSAPVQSPPPAQAQAATPPAPAAGAAVGGAGMIQANPALAQTSPPSLAQTSAPSLAQASPPQAQASPPAQAQTGPPQPQAAPAGAATPEVGAGATEPPADAGAEEQPGPVVDAADSPAGAGDGRSPKPPPRDAPTAPASGETTEILRPQAGGS